MFFRAYLFSWLLFYLHCSKTKYKRNIYPVRFLQVSIQMKIVKMMILSIMNMLGMFPQTGHQLQVQLCTVLYNNKISLVDLWCTMMLTGELWCFHEAGAPITKIFITELNVSLFEHLQCKLPKKYVSPSAHEFIVRINPPAITSSLILLRRGSVTSLWDWGC
jgi:hypothetical protein